MIKLKSSFQQNEFMKGKVTLMSDTKRTDTSSVRRAQENKLIVVCLIGSNRDMNQKMLECAMKSMNEYFSVVTSSGKIVCLHNGKFDKVALNEQVDSSLSDNVWHQRIYEALERVQKVGKVAILYNFPSTVKQAELLADEISFGDYILKKVIVVRQTSYKTDEFDMMESKILSVLTSRISTSISEISERGKICAQRRLNVILADIAEI